jgi:type II secretory pathway pseudopilin PulG
MNCAKSSNSQTANGGFTLAEVLAALLFMAIVIPVAVQALLIAGRAGEVAQRKGEAARVAERILNESIITTNWIQSSQSGTIEEGIHEFKWVLRNDIWDQGTTNVINTSSSASGQIAGAQPPVDQFTAGQISMSLLTVEVTYAVQDKDYSVRLSTLVAPQ